MIGISVEGPSTYGGRLLPLLAQQLLTVHKSVGFSLLGLIAIHVSAALVHHFWRRDDTLTAMLPAANG
jgi:cytochrome b561